VTARAAIAAPLALILAACAGPADRHKACPPAPLVVDVGHTPQAPGATSASGVPELVYNRRFADLLVARLVARGVDPADIVLVVIDEADPRLDLRVAMIAERSDRPPHRPLLISIHHDSVQERYLKSHILGGVELTYTDAARGFSLFVPAETEVATASLAAARAVADRLLYRGENPNRHHAERVEGRPRHLLDRDRAVYAGDFLKILRTAESPALLLEVAVIKNPADETRVADPRVAAGIADAVAAALTTLPCPG